MKTKVSEEDYETYQHSGVTPQNREITAENINKGLSMEMALDSPYGKVLTKDLDAMEMERLDEIVRFKHDKEQSVEQNYANINALILSYTVAHDVKIRQQEVIKTMEESYKRIKTISQKVKSKSNGGRR